VESSPVELDPLPLSAQEYVEVRVAQDLPWLNTRGMCWKVLLGARTSSGTVPGESGDSSSGSHVLANLGRQMSAGVSVAF
jgi:hypothetical protein